MKLKKLLAEIEVGRHMAGDTVPTSASQMDVDVESTLQDFKDRVEDSTSKEKAQHEQELKRKLQGKNITFRGSKGYKQAEKDYEINVRDVSIQYHYEDYFIVLKDEKGADYFFIEGYPVRVHAQDEAPTPTLTQNTSDPVADSPHRVKQF